MGSEDQVNKLMVLLDTGVQQANRIEETLNEYEKKLQVFQIHVAFYLTLHTFS